MVQCKQCGTTLPDQAGFCFQCGTPVKAEEPQTPAPDSVPPAPPRELDFVRPALTGGAFLGILSSLPLISAGNCICCMWVLGGGAIATFLLAQQQPNRRLNSGDGAFAGVCSGLFGAMIATLISIPLKIISAPFLEAERERLETTLKDMPELLELFRRFTSPEITAVTLFTTFVSNLIMYSLFAMIGGILMVAYLNRQSQSRVDRPLN
jgi:hypothetical protein